MIITIANKKGGVGKTSTIRNLIYEFSKKGMRVLAIDTDPQGNLTNWLLTDETPRYNVGDILAKYCHINEAIEKTGRNNVDCISFDEELSKKENDLISSDRIDQATCLLDSIQEIESNYDVVLIDTSPFFNLITLQSMTSSNLLIVPLKMETDSILGAIATINEAKKISHVFGRPLDYRLLITMKNRNKVTSESIEELRELYKGKVLETVLRFQEKPTTLSNFYKKAVGEVDPKSKLALEYVELSNEVQGIVSLRDTKKVQEVR